MTLDLRKDAARDIVKQLSSQADALIENFRPGVMEKWGLGPKVCMNASALASTATKRLSSSKCSPGA